MSLQKRKLYYVLTTVLCTTVDNTSNPRPRARRPRQKKYLSVSDIQYDTATGSTLATGTCTNTKGKVVNPCNIKECG